MSRIPAGQCGQIEGPSVDRREANDLAQLLIDPDEFLEPLTIAIKIDQMQLHKLVDTDAGVNWFGALRLWLSHTAALIDRRRADARTIASQNLPEVEQLHIRAVALDQLSEPQSTAPLAPSAADL